MMTRRTVLELALAAGAARAAPPFALPPQEAAAALDAPFDAAPLGTGPSRRRFTNDPYEPIDVAESLDGEDIPALMDHIAPQARAADKQAREAMVDEMPVLARLPVPHPWHDMDEEAIGPSMESSMAGVRVGAAYEHLRLALLAPAHVCRARHGHGDLWGGKPFPERGGERTVGAARGGRGVVPTPAPASPELTLPVAQRAEGVAS